MHYNLTDSQKDLLRWIVTQVRSGRLTEEFLVMYVMSDKGYVILGYDGDEQDLPSLTQGMLNSLEAADLILCTPEYSSFPDGPRILGQRCVLRGSAYEAVNSDFNAPDTSFVKHLTPLADVTTLDTEIKTRCLPILGAGSADPKLWDSAVRTAGVILEERLRTVGQVQDPRFVGRDLVNAVFGQNGTLAAKFQDDGERQGYRDLYAGVVGAFRNPYAHRLVDPAPEDGGAFIVFINVMLKMLADLQ